MHALQQQQQQQLSGNLLNRVVPVVVMHSLKQHCTDSNNKGSSEGC